MGLEVKSSHRYTAFAWPHGFHSPCLRQYWELLFAKQETPGAVYQSPEFFDYLKETGEKTLDVITVKDRAMDAIVGVVPVQKASTQLPFFLGERTLARSRVKSLTLLGSEPMMPQDPDALDSLFLLMSEHYPESQVVDMDAVPEDGYLWKYLNASPVIKKSYDLHVLHGFRDCHSVDIPPSIGEYYRRLTKKRRYNLLRQEAAARTDRPAAQACRGRPRGKTSGSCSTPSITSGPQVKTMPCSNSANISPWPGTAFFAASC